jgi:hypothetical protein
MYICNTEVGDVSNALKNLVECKMLGRLENIDKDKPQLIQVGMRRYRRLKKAERGDILAEIEKKKITHLINFRTRTLHKKSCPYAGKNVLRAYLTTIKGAGLDNVCNHCMPD